MTAAPITDVEPKVADPKLAEKEATAAKAAKVLGAPVPPTPNLDQLNKEKETMTTSTKAPKARATRGASNAVALHVSRGEGKPFSSMAKKVSTLAYFYTKGIEGAKERITVERFRELVAKAGGDLTTSGWKVTLPNGVIIDARPAGSTSTGSRDAARAAAAAATQDKPELSTGATSPKPAPKVEKATKATKKASEKKAPASKVSPTARKAAVKAANPTRPPRTVTPIPKASTGRRSTRAN